jgi:hypothetical protein
MERLPPSGTFCWPVNIFQRVQTPNASVGIAEALVNVITCAAAIIPIGRMARYTGIIADDNLFRATHEIWVEWVPYGDVTYEITRLLNTPDCQTRLETFTVLGGEEVGDMLWFTRFDVILFSTTWSPGLSNL